MTALLTALSTRRTAIIRSLLLVVVFGAAFGFWQALPQPLFDTSYSTVLLDRDGQLLGAQISDDEQWRFPTGNTVPDKFKAAIIAFEDKRFYRHPGVDPMAIARALRSNVREQEIVSGASTLTMQVIRLASGHNERSYRQKFKEALLALRLEMSYSKDEILTLYANHAPFGGNVVGIEAAAWRYFGRPAAELSWAESATLAVLPNQPSLIHLNRNRERLQQKRDALLQRLHQQQAFDDIEMQLALLEPLPQSPKPLPQLAPHLFATLQAQQPLQHRITTTLDVALQKQLLDLMHHQQQQLLLKGIHNAALLVVDRQTMEVVAYLGNSQWHTQGEQGYALDLVQAKRSTGSILKPFLYAGMLQTGQILPHTLVQDRPSLFRGYRPENYDRQYRGVVPASEALTRSLNIPAVRMLRDYGIEAFYTDLKSMGMSTLFRTPDEYGLPLILGGAETTLWDITQMYANLAITSQSQQTRPIVEWINVQQDANLSPAQTMPFGPGAAWLTMEALLDVSRPGLDSHWRRFSSSQNISWKTGTSYGLRDGWAVGNNGRYTVGVWVGNATGVGNADLTGLGAAAPLLFDAFDRLGYQPWLTKPAAFLKTVMACRNDGYLANGNCETLATDTPMDAHFEQASPYHQTIHLDSNALLRVNNACAPIRDMRSQSWFVLPPALEYFYIQSHDDYKPLPPYRSDCSGQINVGDNPIDLIYPDAHTEVYIPTDIDGQRSAVVFEAVHRSQTAALFWHLNDSFLAQTREFHQLAVDVEPGWHSLTLVDENGQTFQRRFLVLGE